MSTTQVKSNLTLPLCLIWKTERPYKNKHHVSPGFTFMGCDWHLELWIRTSLSPNCLGLLIQLDNEEPKELPTFKVETYYKCKGMNSDPLFYTFRNITVQYDLRWTYISEVPLPVVKEKIPDFEKLDTFRIVCILNGADNSTQLFGSESQQSIHFPLKAEGPSNSEECSSSDDGDQPFSLENLSEDLDALLDNKILPDVQLMVEGTSIPCHRSILVARSKVFAAMFQHEMTESTSGVLKMKDIDLSTAELFLKYLYSGKFPGDLTEDMLVKLFETGDKYDVKALKTVTSKRMIKNINDENCLYYLRLGDIHNDQEFKDAVVCYIVKDGRIIKSEDWKKFAAENPTLAVEVFSKYVEKLEMNCH